MSPYPPDAGGQGFVSFWESSLAQAPDTLTTGTTWSWTASADQYPASDGWVLTYFFRSGPESFTVASEADGDSWTATAGAAVTANFLAGSYVVSATVAKDGEVREVWRGSVTLQPGPGAASTRNEQILELLEAAMVAKAGDPVLRRRVNNREIQEYGAAELLRLIAFYRQAVVMERSGGRFSSTQVVFRAPA